MSQAAQNAQASNNLGVQLYSDGKTADAVAAFREAIRLDPNFAHAHFNLANILQDSGFFAEALLGYRHALALNPHLAEFHFEYANALRATAQLSAAEAAYREALRLDPTHADAQCNLGRTLAAQGRRDEAIACYRAALARDPDWVDPLIDLGNALKESGHEAQAVAAYRQVIARNPEHAGAHNNLALILTDSARTREAIPLHRRAIALAPQNASLHSNLLVTLNYDVPPIGPHDGQEHFREALAWAHRHAEPLSPAPTLRLSGPDRPLCIGYVSPDFRDHPVAAFLAPLLEHHDPSAFHIICYSDVRQPDAVTESLRRQADLWRPIVGQSDAAVADLVRRDAIDILVDLAGHTARNRLLVFARKPAPIQVSYLGYPATTGLSTIDYRLTDARADPPTPPGRADALHAETLYRLPHTAWCFASPGDLPILPRPTGPGICFGSFNNFAKVSPTIARLWAKILSAVPNSRLLLKAQGFTDPDKCTDVRAHLAAHGIDPARLDLHPGLALRSAHLAIYNKMDIALDTFPYHGTTTTCEALWMGVPVITLAGTPHVSRVGASLLGTLGLDDLITHTPEQYITRAATLAADAPRRALLRQSLRPRMGASPLMDAPAFARDIESAFRQMWKTHSQQPPSA